MMMPRLAASYDVYLRKPYGERVAFMCGITNFFLSSAGSISTGSRLARHIHLQHGAPWKLAQKASHRSQPFCSSSSTSAAFVGVRWCQNIFHGVKAPPDRPHHHLRSVAMGNDRPIGSSFPSGKRLPSGADSQHDVLCGARYALGPMKAGPTSTFTIAEEIKEPKRNIPLALIGSIVGLRFSTSSLTLPSGLSPTISSEDDFGTQLLPRLAVRLRPIRSLAPGAW